MIKIILLFLLVSPVYFPSFWIPFKVYKLLLVSPSPSHSTAFRLSGICLPLLSFVFTCWKVLFFFLIYTCFGFLITIRWSLCISKSREFYAFHFLEQILVCADTICQHGQSLTFSTIPSGSSFLPHHVYSYIPFVSIWCIRLLCN